MLVVLNINYLLVTLIILVNFTTIIRSLDFKLMMKIVVLSNNYNVVILILNIVTTWQLSKVPKFRPWALKTALGKFKNVFWNNRNVEISVDKCFRVLTIIVIIVQILLLESLWKMIFSMQKRIIFSSKISVINVVTLKLLTTSSIVTVR